MCLLFSDQLLAVFRIRDMLARIRMRILGSVPLTNRSGCGSGSGFCSFSPMTFKMPTKNIFFANFVCLSFLKVHLHYLLKIISHKEVTNSWNHGFSEFFYLLMEGSGAGSGSVQINYGSRCGFVRPKNIRTDPVLEHWLLDWWGMFFPGSSLTDHWG